MYFLPVHSMLIVLLFPIEIIYIYLFTVTLNLPFLFYTFWSDPQTETIFIQLRSQMAYVFR